MEHGEVISNFETGNPPVGWESEGQLRISNSKKHRADCRLVESACKALFYPTDTSGGQSDCRIQILDLRVQNLAARNA